MKRLTVFIAILLVVFGLNHVTAQVGDSILVQPDVPQYGKPFKKVPDRRDVSIYQVNIRSFSANGDFKGVIARLDSIKALGINVVYLLPIYPVGVLKASGS